MAPGIFVWRTLEAYGPLTSTAARVGEEIYIIDAVWPIHGGALHDRLATAPPTMLVVLKPDHVRDLDAFAGSFPAARPFGPWLFHLGDVPKTNLEELEPGMSIPGGGVALYDGRGRLETPLWLPDHRTIIFADAFHAIGGDLRVWPSASHEERALPALRAMRDLPFERVIVSHGEPVHRREAFEQALARAPRAPME